jgi:putative membrane protein
MFLWIKAFHIIFMVCWFAGIFYLPRLFVNHAMSEDAATRTQLTLMEGKLYRFITPFAFLTVGLGFWLIALNWEYYRSAGWLHLKILLVLLLCIYHYCCGRIVKQFRTDQNHRSHIYFRIFNEIPVLILFAVVILVVIRPF